MNAAPALGLNERLKLLRDGVFNMAPPIASAVMGLATVALKLAYLPAEAYGLWISLQAIVVTASIVDFGIGWSITYQVGGDPQAVRSQTQDHLAGAAAFLALLGTLGGVVVFGLSLYVIRTLDTELVEIWAQAVIAAATALIFAANRYSHYVLSVLYGARRFDVTGALAAGQTVAIGVGTIYFAVVARSLIPIALWHASMAILFTLFAWLALRGFTPALAFRPKLTKLASILATARFNAASQLADLGQIAVWEVGTFILGAWHGAAAIVPFHVGMRIPKTFGTIMTNAAEIMMPAGAATRGTAHVGRDRDMVIEGLRLNIMVALPVALVLHRLAPDLLKLWLGHVDPMILAVLNLGLLAILVQSFSSGVLFFLWGRADNTQILIATLGRAVLVAVASILIIPSLGTQGAALAILVGFLIITLWLLWRVPVQGAKTHFSLPSVTQGFVVPTLAAYGMTAGVARLLPEANLVAMAVTALAGATTFLVLFLSYGAAADERALAFGFAQRLATRAGRIIKALRGELARFRMLRSLWHALIEIATRASGRWRQVSAQSDALFATTQDPWGYADERHQVRLARAEALIDQALSHLATSPKILEFACAEGHLTQRLAARTEYLTCFDISPTALARARALVGTGSHHHFIQGDITSDPLPEGFDLVVVDGLLDYFRSRSMLQRLGRRLVACVKPGGYMLIGNVRQHEIIETAPWARWWVRGGRNVNLFVAQAAGFPMRVEDTDAFYSYVLVQRPSEP